MVFQHKIIGIGQHTHPLVTEATSWTSWPKKQHSSLEFNQEIYSQMITFIQTYMNQRKLEEMLFGIRVLLWALKHESNQFDTDTLWPIIEKIPEIFELPQFQAESPGYDVRNDPKKNPEKQIFSDALDALKLGKEIAQKYNRLERLIIIVGKISSFRLKYGNNMGEELEKLLTSSRVLGLLSSIDKKIDIKGFTLHYDSKGYEVESVIESEKNITITLKNTSEKIEITLPNKTVKFGSKVVTDPDRYILLSNPRVFSEIHSRHYDIALCEAISSYNNNPTHIQNEKTLTQVSAFLQYVYTYTPKLELTLVSQNSVEIATLYQEMATQLFEHHPEKAWRLLRQIKEQYLKLASIENVQPNTLKGIVGELLKSCLQIAPTAPPLWHQRRVELQKLRGQVALDIAQNKPINYLTATFEALFKDIWTESMTEIGLEPCDWAILAFGSMAQGTMTPYSDVEYAILIKEDTPKIQAYFKAVSNLFELKVTLLGETSPDSTKKLGFCVDVPDTEDGITIIIKTPARFLDCLPRISSDALKLRHSIYHHRFLLGDKGLHDALVRILPTLSSNDILTFLDKDHINAKPHIFRPTIFDPVSLKFWQKLLEYSIQGIGDFERIQERKVMDCLAAISDTAIPSVIKTHLREALNFLHQLRCQAQLRMRAQVDEVWLSQLSGEAQGTLQDIYHGVMVPLIRQGAMAEYDKNAWISEWIEHGQRLLTEKQYTRAAYYSQSVLSLRPFNESARFQLGLAEHGERLTHLSHHPLPNSNNHNPFHYRSYRLNGIFSGTRSLQLPVDDAVADYPINDYPGQGNHTVLHLGPIHLKLHPEFPGTEFAVSRLFHHLIGHGAPYCETAILYPEDVSEMVPDPILLSETVAGESLKSRLENDPYLRHSRMDPSALQELTLAMMLVDQEDGKPDNFKLLTELDSHGQLSSRLICIDNDHAFCTQTYVKNTEKIQVNTKNILFCLDQMMLPIDPACRKKFLNMDIFTFLQSWVDELLRYDHQLMQLLGPEKGASDASGYIEDQYYHYRRSEGQQGSVLKLLIKNGTIQRIADRLIRIKRLLRQPDIRLIDILKELDIVIGKFYEVELTQSKPPIDRFLAIEDGQYIRDIMGFLGTRSKDTLLYKLETIPEKITESDLLQSLEQSVLNAQGIKKELEAVFEITGKRASCQAALKRGDITEWAKIGIGIPAIQEELLNNIDWNSTEQVQDARPDEVIDPLPIDVFYGFGPTIIPGDSGVFNAENLLQNLSRLNADLSIQHLTFKACPITDTQLGNLLKRCPKLIELQLTNCPNITGREGVLLVNTIASFLSPLEFLEKLTLENLPNLTEFSNRYRFQPTGFPRLQKVRIRECPNLTKLELLNCSNLQELVYRETPRLSEIRLRGSSLLNNPVFIRQLLGPNLTDATDLARLFPPHILAPTPPTAIPPLPPGLETFLASPCKLLEGKGLKYGFPTNDPLAKDTHTVFLLPPLSICDWQHILDDKTHNSPHKDGKFHSAFTTWFIQTAEQQRWSNQKPTAPQWIIMPKMMIPDSYFKTFEDQRRMIPTGYTIPTATQLTAQICLHFLQTGEKLYGDTYKKYTKDSLWLPYARTSDTATSGYRVNVGDFDSDGLYVGDSWVDCDDDPLGLAARAGLEMPLGH